jgi:hypothetical protein
VQRIRIAEIIFRAGSVQRRLHGAIDEKRFVAFAKPSRLRLDHAKHGPDVVPAPAHLKQIVQAPRARRDRLPVERVKIERVHGRAGQFFPIHLIVETVGPARAFVGHRDPAGFAKRHRPVAISRAPRRAHAHHLRIDVALQTVKAFFRAYELRMDTLVTHPLFEYRVSYRRLLEIQSRLLARVLEGEIGEYPVFTTR